MPSSTVRREDCVLIEGVTKGFGEGVARVAAVDDVSLSVERGQFVTVIGPSGCGKTTLLRIVAGLLGVDRGEVSIFGESVAVATERKHIGFVPQSPALFPWRSVLDNVRLPLEVNKKAAASGRAVVDPVALLQSFGLGHALRRRPAELSGGMQQRVAIARAFVFDPPILLMDEPFAAVDELTRESLRHELLSIWQANKKTVIFVTHSIAEAIALSDAVVIMSPHPGRIQRIVPVNLRRPRDEMVETTSDFHELEREVRMEIRSGWAR
ncbi:MAG TPA: ABC transporter ATP-binding protein [Acidimicrobiales bacterium]|nr:ABC transporter ATP-binding protein [Acidimicrobiales bacterium]